MCTQQQCSAAIFVPWRVGTGVQRAAEAEPKPRLYVLLTAGWGFIQQAIRLLR